MTVVFARSTNYVGHVGPAALIRPDRTALRGIAPTTTRCALAVTILGTRIPETRGTTTVQLATATAIAVVVQPVATLVQTEGTRSEALNMAIRLLVVANVSQSKVALFVRRTREVATLQMCALWLLWIAVAIPVSQRCWGR